MGPLRRRGMALVSLTERVGLGYAASLLLMGSVLACLPPSQGERADAPEQSSTEPQRGRVRVVAVFPHQTDAFTQGLLYHQGLLFESTGLEGRSTLRKVELATGRVLQERKLPPEDFGEGLALGQGFFVQLTWKQGRAYRWSVDNLQLLGSWSYSGEGWGLTFDGQQWIQSDGTAHLLFRDRESFSVLKVLEVRRSGNPVPYLNELEWARGRIYANVWSSDEVLEIDPHSGVVLTVFDAGGLLQPHEQEKADVLNGIAWNPDTDHFFLTGKLWPWVFEVELLREPGI